MDGAVRSRYSPAVMAGFDLVFRPWMRRRLGGVHIRGLPAPGSLPGLPLLIVANHVSWWDGFLIREIHRQVRPGAPLHVVMEAEELARHPLFRWMGVLPLERSVGGLRRLVRDLEARCLETPDAVIGYFPQGRIWPSRRRPLGFQRGAAWLAARLAPVTVLPVALHLEPLTGPGPVAFVSAGTTWTVRSVADAGTIEAAVRRPLDELLAFLDQHGEDAAVRWKGAA